MKAFTAPKGIIAVVLCYSAIITFSSFLGEAVYAHSGGGSTGSGNSNNHEHGRVVSISELLLQVTPFAGGLATGFTFLFWKREIMDKIRVNKNPGR
jgi:hypothetical protein